MHTGDMRGGQAQAQASSTGLQECRRHGQRDTETAAGAQAHPTRMPSSMSVGATLSPRPTTNCAQGTRAGERDVPNFET